MKRSRALQRAELLGRLAAVLALLIIAAVGAVCGVLLVEAAHTYPWLWAVLLAP